MSIDLWLEKPPHTLIVQRLMKRFRVGQIMRPNNKDSFPNRISISPPPGPTECHRRGARKNVRSEEWRRAL